MGDVTTRKNPPNGSGNKLIGLEIIRFVSAIAVLFYHYRHFAFVSDRSVGLVKEQLPFYPFFSLFYDKGFMGVQVFWCISGFIFFWKYRDTIADRLVGARKFFVLRFSRLYPLHFATLLLVAALQWVHVSQHGFSYVYQNNDAPHFLLQLFMASNWHGTEKGSSFNGPIWSISIEVLVYLFFFVMLRFAGRSAWINVGVLGLWLAAKALKVPSAIIECLAFFYAGGLAAIVSRALEPTRWRQVAVGVSVAVTFLAPVAVYQLAAYENYRFMQLFLMAYVPMLVYAASRDIHLGTGFGKAVEVAGNMTYSSYLIHFPIQLSTILFLRSSNTPVPLYEAGFFVAYLSAVLLAAYLLYRFFEMPAQAFIRARFR
jgi:peptidoglycan/LPS O-acetylase OafA/YrhL